MKTFWSSVLITLAAPAFVHAHEMEGGSTSGLFGLKPEYLHVLLNPLPGYGLMVGLAVLLAGIIFRQPVLRVAGLIIVGICAVSAWPVLYFGQHGYNSLYPQLDTESAQWLDTHMSRAERFIYLFYVTAALAVGALLCLKKRPRLARALSVITLLAAFACMGVGAWIARAGGEVSHSEFRVEGSSPEIPSHSHARSMTHDAGDDSSSNTNSEIHEHKHPAQETGSSATNYAGAADKNPNARPAPEHQHGREPAPPKFDAEHQHPVPAASTASPATTDNPHAAPHPVAASASPQTDSTPAHQHEKGAPTAPTNSTAAPHQHDHAATSGSAKSRGTNSPPVASPNWTPDTPEGIWKELHRHESELQTAIEAKQLDKIHAHAEAVKHLTAALAEVVHPDYKTSVAKGADKVNQGISAVHQSAHAEDLAGVESHFKEFNEALRDLEQQMKKQ